MIESILEFLTLGTMPVGEEEATKLTNLPLAFAVLLATWFLIWVTRRSINAIAAAVPERSRPRVQRWYPALRLIMQLVAVIAIIMLVTESPTATLLSTVVAIGVIMRDYFSSLIAGVVAMWEMPYRPGDWIELGGHYGKVQDMGVRTVRMVTPDDTVIVVPHSVIWSGVVANANDGQPDHMCVANFYIHPNHDARSVRQKLRDVAITSPFILLDKEPVVIVLEKPWATHYRVKAYPVSGDDEFRFISDLTIRGKEALIDMGCQHAVVPASVAA